MVIAAYILLGVLLTAWTAQAVLASLLSRKLWKRVTRPRRDVRDQYRPHAVVIMPFKGVEPRLDAALDRLMTQDYPDYRVVLVVESESDPAYGLLQQAIARHPERRCDLLVAGVAGPRQGQKVHNQLFALEHLKAVSNRAVLVFADSDAVPGPMWLGDMVGPLVNPTIGVTTGYRWLAPVGGGLWSNLASVMNASVASLLSGRASLGHAWGGSMAMHADMVSKHDLHGRLNGALTDDFPVSRMCRDAGLRIYFVASCLVPTPAEFSFSSLANFAHRQYLITRVYAPRLYFGALAITWLYVAGLVVAAGSRTWLGLAAIMTVFAADQVRATYRAKVVEAAFDTSVQQQLQTSLRWDRWATPLWMLLHALLILRAVFGRRMIWRGTQYFLRGPNNVERQ